MKCLIDKMDDILSKFKNSVLKILLSLKPSILEICPKIYRLLSSTDS